MSFLQYLIAFSKRLTDVLLCLGLSVWLGLSWLEGRASYDWFAQVYAQAARSPVMGGLFSAVPGLIALVLLASLIVHGTKRLPRPVLPVVFTIGLLYACFPFQLFLRQRTGVPAVEVKPIQYGYGAPGGCIVPLTGPHWAIIITIPTQSDHKPPGSRRS